MIQPNKNLFEENDNAKEIDSIIEDIKSEYGEDVASGELCKTYIMRLKEANKTKDAEQLEEREGLIPYTADEIGKKYGGGHYQLSFRVYKREGDKLKQAKWPKFYFTLGDNYNRYRDAQKQEEDLKQLEYKLKTGQLLTGANNGANEFMMAYMKELKASNDLLIKTMLENRQPQNSIDIPALITAIVPLMQMLMPKQDDSYKELLLNQLAEKNNQAKEAFSMMKDGFELGKAISGGSSEPSTLDTILNSIPAIAESFKPLLSGMGARLSVHSARKIAGPKLNQYTPQITALKENPKALEAFSNEMKKHYSPDQVKRGLEIAGIETPSKLEIK